MKKIVLIVFAICLGFTGFSQQDAMFTHYSFNTLAVNAGYAGSRDALTVTGLHRSQWISFPGAPTTQTLTVHAPLMEDKLGIGFSLLNDKIGPTSMTGFNVDLAYKIQVGATGKLAFGLKGGLNMRSSDLASEVQVNDPGDVAFDSDIRTDLLPNFGFGLYYSNPKMYIGLSTPRLLENDLNSGLVSSASELKRHYFLIAGTIFNVNKTGSVKLKPTTFFKVTEAAPVELDLTALFYFKDKYWVGPMWRSTDAFGILAGLNITDQFGFGYSFDWSYANTTGAYNAGSHEIMLRYDFVFKNKGNIFSPRYF